MQIEVTISKTDAQEILEAAIVSRIATPANRPLRVQEVRWDSYGRNVVIGFTDESQVTE